MMKTEQTVKGPQTEAQIRECGLLALELCLRQVPDAKVSVSWAAIANSMLPALVTHFTHTGRTSTLLAEVKRTGEPRHALNAFNQLDQYRQAFPGAVQVFIAPYISPETAEACRVRNVSYLDFAGNCHIAFDGIYVHVEGRPNPAAHSRPLRSLYQPKAERVLRVLLTQPVRLWRLQALADEAGVSVGQVFKVKELLKEKEWLEETEQGLFLAKPGELLTAWAERYRFSKHQATQFHTLTELATFEREVSTICRSLGRSCAITGLAAAAQYTPYAIYQRTTVYVSGDLAIFQEPFNLVPVETGANVVLLTPYDDGVFYDARPQQGISLASPLQTYLDLQSAGGRGREVAEILLQKEIVSHWG